MLKKTCKKLIALILCTAIFVTSIPYTKAYANEETAKYPYVMYASSKQEGAIALNADYVCVNGDIATKGTIIKGTNGNYNGIITENSDSNMLYIQDKLNDRYFSSQEKKDSLNLQERYANINEDIGTYNDITLKGDNLNANNVILYSERGDIYIDMDNMSFTGLIYAPCGNVEIEAQNVNLNSVIIIAKTITINATCINVNYNNNIAGIVGIVPDLHDTDDDGLYDVYEDLFATDVKSKDTDNDGLSDYQEIFITNTDELVSCSQAIGVLDGEYDADGDELTALEEVTYGVAWDKADTDEDGLTDYEEIKIYNSNPLNQDTDGDGLKDVEEITLGLDANNIDTDANGIIDGEEYIKQDVNIETYEEGFLDNNLAIPTITNIIAKGDINSRLVVKEYNGHLAKNSKVCIGKVVEISGADIAGGTISFKLTNDYILNDYEIAGYKTNGLLICYHNGETLEPLTTEYDEENRVLSANIVDVGMYYVMDVVKFTESMGIDLNDEEYIVEETTISTFSLRSSNVSIGTAKVKGQAEIVFLIDTTGSMSGVINNVKENINDFAKELEAADIYASFALVEYRDITCDGQASTKIIKNGNSNWYRSSEDLKNAISTLEVTGGGDIEETVIDGLEFARRLDFGENTQKFIIVVTDAGYKIANNYGIESLDEIINLLKNDGINVSVVSGNYYKETYKPLYNSTEGVFANINGDFREELLKVAEVVEEDTNAGYWIILNGIVPRTVKLNDNPVNSIYEDTDADGLFDKEELGVRQDLFLNNYSSKLNYGISRKINLPDLPVYNYNTDPTCEDTDSDDIPDDEEDIIGTSGKVADSDSDGLSDGMEVKWGYNPLRSDPDYDGKSDKEEYLAGTSPYEYNKSKEEYISEFLYGFVCGDFIEDTTSIPMLLGQITSNFIAVADVRDVVANIYKGDLLFAGLNLAGLIPVVGDTAKAVSKTSKFILKNADDVAVVAATLNILRKNSPELVKLVGKSDEAAEAIKLMSKSSDVSLTKSEAKALAETIELAGLTKHVKKTSIDLEIDGMVYSKSGEVWSKNRYERGNEIDELLNRHEIGEGLGTRFPVADRITDRVLISTKSIDLEAPTYKNPAALKRLLNRYYNQLDGFENRMKDDSLYWAGSHVSIDDYDKKMIEIALPDVIISESIKKELDDFKINCAERGIEVIYKLILD